MIKYNNRVVKMLLTSKTIDIENNFGYYKKSVKKRTNQQSKYVSFEQIVKKYDKLERKKNNRFKSKRAQNQLFLKENNRS